MISGHLVTRFVDVLRYILLSVDCLWTQSWSWDYFPIRTHAGRTVVWPRETPGRKRPDGVSFGD